MPTSHSSAAAAGHINHTGVAPGGRCGRCVMMETVITSIAEQNEALSSSLEAHKSSEKSRLKWFQTRLANHEEARSLELNDLVNQYELLLAELRAVEAKTRENQLAEMRKAKKKNTRTTSVSTQTETSMDETEAHPDQPRDFSVKTGRTR